MCRPEACFAHFTGLKTSDANFYFCFFTERSNSVAIGTERFALKFNGSWPLPMGALMLRVVHLLMKEESYASLLLTYFGGL